ncbi:hypothetical protein M501DRAFT_1019512 [Patellaria atrata CBS 101060]|uniref:Uncharacterized protein n=1 Tax=Patellaria atrata CBS 101060 TaxID=1346257 RepID=A0A9P4S497_9PEZI|nr:hypothetical protein M501DRAFT_1019512 [Patellaria atrata CBS 101060]
MASRFLTTRTNKSDSRNSLELHWSDLRTVALEATDPSYDTFSPDKRSGKSIGKPRRKPNPLKLKSPNSTGFFNSLFTPLKTPGVSPYKPQTLDKPLPRRPRSQTDPPVFQIAELPGSILLENRGFPLTAIPVEGPSGGTEYKRTSRSSYRPVGRAHSSPTEATRPSYTHRSAASESRIDLQSQNAQTLEPERKDDAQVVATQNPSSEIVQILLEEEQHPLNTTEVPKHQNKPSADVQVLYQLLEQQNEDYFQLQRDHESYISSLQDAHVREIATVRTYYSRLLRKLQQEDSHANSARPALDTGFVKSNGLPTPGLSATGNRSFRVTLDTEIRATTKSEDVESLKKRPSLSQKRVIEADTVRKELDSLRISLDEERERSTKAQEREFALNCALSELKKRLEPAWLDISARETLEARLQNAWMQMHDTNEENYALQVSMQMMKKRTLKLTQDIKLLKLHSKNENLDRLSLELETTKSRNDHLEKQLCAATDRNRVPSIILEFAKQIEVLQQEIKQSHRMIDHLQQQNDLCPLRFLTGREQQLATCDHSKARCEVEVLRDEVSNLKDRVIEDEKTINKLMQSKIRADADRLDKHQLQNKLLSRMMSRVGSELDLSRKKSLIQQRYISSSAISETDQAEDLINQRFRTARLEKEIDYYVNEIVIYESEKRAYKRDIKRLESKFKKAESGTNSTYTGSSTPSLTTSPSSSAGPSMDTPLNTVGLGLGLTFTPDPNSLSPTSRRKPAFPRLDSSSNTIPTYTLPFPLAPKIHPPLPMPTSTTPSQGPHHTPSNPLVTLATPIQLKQVTPLQHIPSALPVTPPPQNSKLAASPHEETPPGKPPRRVDTQRSLSDSIISSYARVSTPLGAVR